MPDHQNREGSTVSGIRTAEADATAATATVGGRAPLGPGPVPGEGGSRAEAEGLPGGGGCGDTSESVPAESSGGAPGGGSATTDAATAGAGGLAAPADGAGGASGGERLGGQGRFTAAGRRGWRGRLGPSLGRGGRRDRDAGGRRRERVRESGGAPGLASESATVPEGVGAASGGRHRVAVLRRLFRLPPLPSRMPRPHRDDLLVALAGLTGGLVQWTFGPFDDSLIGAGNHDWLTLLPLVAVCLAAVGRRIAQPWALLLATAALVADMFTGSLLAVIIVFTDLVYAAVLYGPRRISRAMVPGSTALTVAVTVTLLAVLQEPVALLLGALCAGVTVTPASTGAIIRDHRNAAAAERLRAEQTALLAEMDRAQAVNAERTRMARELHDVVANHLSAIAIHSTAALSLEQQSAEQQSAERSTDGGPSQRAPAPGGLEAVEGREGTADAGGGPTLDALGVIRENSVQGLAEMRRLIGLLRETDETLEEPAATPSLDSLDTLLDRAHTAVESERPPGGAGAATGPSAVAGGKGGDGSGSRSGFSFVLLDEREPGDSPPAPVELAAYRIVQESVTNAVKHAAPGPVTVRLTYETAPTALLVRVTSRRWPHDGSRGAAAGGAQASGGERESRRGGARGPSGGGPSLPGEPPGEPSGEPSGDFSGGRPRAPGSGVGLVGMRERVELLGGQLEAGPYRDPEGTELWLVRGELPVEESARQRPPR